MFVSNFAVPDSSLGKGSQLWGGLGMVRSHLTTPAEHDHAA
jgi:hypothetical protein